MGIGLSNLLMTLFGVSQETAKEMTNSLIILAFVTFIIMVAYMISTNSPHWKNFKSINYFSSTLATILIFTGVSSANAYLIAMILFESRVASQLPNLFGILILLAIYMFAGLRIAKYYVKKRAKGIILPDEFGIYLRQAFISMFALLFIALAISSVNEVIDIFSDGSIISQWKGLLKWLFVALGMFVFGGYFFAIAYEIDNIVGWPLKIMPFQKKSKKGIQKKKNAKK